MQATVKQSVSFSGIGLHGGQPATLTIRPAPAGAGVWFCRVDVTDRDQMVPARFDSVIDTRNCTVVANAEGVRVSTVEHVMAALAGLGVDNALIDVDGPEVPIMDGSAKAFVEGLLSCGLAFQPGPRRALRILEEVTVTRGDASVTFAPSDTPLLEFEIDFADAAIGRQSLAMRLTPERFARSLADSRTFVRLADIQQLHALGLAKGGGLENAIVVDGARVLNPEGLRHVDECVRHKAMDAVGDMALAGGPVIGRYRGVRAGHALTNEALRTLFATPGAWMWEPAPARRLPGQRDGDRIEAAAQIAAE